MSIYYIGNIFFWKHHKPFVQQLVLVLLWELTLFILLHSLYFLSVPCLEDYKSFLQFSPLFLKDFSKIAKFGSKIISSKSSQYPEKKVWILILNILDRHPPTIF